MEPEIARRCKSCGAAIRARSAFCPQCGVAQAEAGAQHAPAAINTSAATAEASQRTTADAPPAAEKIASATQADVSLKTDGARMETPAPESVRAHDAASTGTPPVVNQPQTSDASPGAVAVDDAQGKRQRVTTVNAAPRIFADDGVRHRADKLRRASNVVLDEAAADPSLRFVLVAAALIIISVLLLLLARIL